MAVERNQVSVIVDRNQAVEAYGRHVRDGRSDYKRQFAVTSARMKERMSEATRRIVAKKLCS